MAINFKLSEGLVFCLCLRLCSVDYPPPLSRQPHFSGEKIESLRRKINFYGPEMVVVVFGDYRSAHRDDDSQCLFGE